MLEIIISIGRSSLPYSSMNQFSTSQSMILLYTRDCPYYIVQQDPAPFVYHEVIGVLIQSAGDPPTKRSDWSDSLFLCCATPQAQSSLKLILALVLLNSSFWPKLAYSLVADSAIPDDTPMLHKQRSNPGPVPKTLNVDH